MGRLLLPLRPLSRAHVWVILLCFSACLGWVSLRAVKAAEPAGVVHDDGFRWVSSLEELRSCLSIDGIKVRLKPGTYTLDQADFRHFVVFSGNDSEWDFRGVTILVDNALFRKFGAVAGPDGFYCAFSVTGQRVQIQGLRVENANELSGVQSRNKIFSVVGSGSVLRDVEITTHGSNPWGYGSLFGISSGDVRKMNGIRVGWPAVGVKLIGCRVHMRAMGHAIFVQGATGTVIEDCHVDGLLKRTDEILSEKSGYAFEHHFRCMSGDYIEGVHVGKNGEILPGEMISLSEDGIRLYDQGGGGHETGSTTIRRCTVRQMRRGICTGLGKAADTVVDCEVRDCVAAGFNIGGGDVISNCRADAKYSEALSCPYAESDGANVELQILDSRGGLSNDLLATLNGRNHVVRLFTEIADYVPPSMLIALSTNRGYAFYQHGRMTAENIQLTNETAARVVNDSKSK
jgi:hypothetical protein